MNQITSFIFTKVLAAAPNTKIAIEETGGDSSVFSDLSSLINFVINLVFGVGIALALLFVIIGGIKYITSQGDEGKATEARNTITNAIIGAVVIISFRVLVNLALNIIGQGDLSNWLNN